MSNIIQPIRQYELHVRSKDAQVTGDLNSHLFIDLKEPIIVNARDEEIHMIISTGEIPYSFYNISSNVDNDRILLNGSTTYTITNKNYDVYELAKVLTDDDAFPFAVTWDKFKNKFTFANQESSTQTINWSGSYANRVLGFPSGDAVPDSVVGVGASVESTNVVDLCSVHSLFIKSSTSSNMIFSTRSGFSSIIQKISIDVNSGGIIYLNQNDSRQHTILHSNVDFLELRITDQNDNLINFNGINYEIGVSFFIYPLSKTITERRLEYNARIAPQRAIESLPPNQLRPFTPSNVIRPVEEEFPQENIETPLEHESKKLILDKMIEMMQDE
tara:strand:+ start:5 stop:994 length:990 start_codon:yes stop_codon:yes gene_type:complete